MMRILQLFILLTLCFACGPSSPESDENVTSTNIVTSLPPLKAPDEDHVIYRLYQDSAHTRLRFELIMTRDSVLDGEYRRYFYDGKTPHLVKYYENGLRNGMQTDYYKTGQIMRETPFSMGKVHGIQKKYWQTGEVASEQNFKMDKVGTISEYKKDGTTYGEYPKLVVSYPDTTLENGAILVLVSFEKLSGRDLYYIGELEEGQYFDAENAPRIKNNYEGAGQFLVHPDTVDLPAEFSVVGMYKTFRGNDHFAEVKFTVENPAN